MSERTESEVIPEKKTKDPASTQQNDRIESGIARILDVVEKKKEEDPVEKPKKAPVDDRDPSEVESSEDDDPIAAFLRW